MKIILVTTITLFFISSYASACKTDSDCEKGTTCKIQRVACPKDPHTSTCAERICMKIPQKGSNTPVDMQTKRKL